MAMLKDDPFLLEEERKKKLAAGKKAASQILTPPSMPVAPAKAPAQVEQPPKKPTAIGLLNGPTADIKARVAQVSASMAGYQQGSPITQYLGLAKRMGGQDKVAQRMANVKALWDAYMAPYDGKNMLWQLTNSPLEMHEIEAMMQSGRKALFGSGDTLSEAGMPVRWAESMGYDTTDPADLKKAVSAWSISGGVGAGIKVSAPLPRTWYQSAYHTMLEVPGSQLKAAGQKVWEYAVEKPGEIISPATNPITENVVKPAAQVLGDIASGGHVKEPGTYTEEDWIRYMVQRYPMALGGDYAKLPTLAEAQFVAKEVGEPAWGTEQAQKIVHDDARAGQAVAKPMLTGLEIGATLLGGGMAIGALKAGATAATTGLGAAALTASAGAVKAARTAGMFYAGSQALEEVGSVGVAKVAEVIEKKVETANAAIDNRTGATGDLDRMLEYYHGSDAATGIEIQQEIQKGWQEEGKTIIGAYGQDLEADGLWTYEWDDALRSWWADTRRYNITIQSQLQEAGYIDMDAPIDGLLQGDGADPRWKEALDVAQKDMDAQAVFFADHPMLGKFIEMTGVPLTDAYVGNFWRKTFQNGKLTGLLELLTLEPVKWVGGTYNAVLSSLTYESSVHADTKLQNLKESWLRAVESESPEAAGLQAQVQQRQAELLQTAFIPDPILAATTAFGKDTQEALEWSQDHPNWVLAASLARDVALAAVTPKIKNLTLGRIQLPRTVEAFMSSPRATLRINEMVKWVQKDKPLLAEEVAGHSADSGFLVSDIQHLYDGVAGGKKKPYKVYTDLADRLVSAADAADRSVFERATTLRGSDLGRFMSSVRQTVADLDANGMPIPGSRAAKAAKFIAKEQKASGKALLDLDNVVKDWAASNYWAPAGGKFASIFPDFDSPQHVKKATHLNRSIINLVSKVGNDPLRQFLSVGLSKVEKKPLRHLDVEGIYNNDRVFYNGLMAFGDVSKALEMESRWRRNPAAVSRLKVAEEARDALNKRFTFSSKDLMEEPESAIATGVDPRTGKTIQEGTVAVPNYLRYTADFGPVNQLNAHVNILSEWTFARKAVTAILTNPTRAFSRGVTPISSFMRRWTVALGPMLFVKHAVADSSRTLIEQGPRALFNVAGESKGLESRIATASPQTMSMVRYRRERMRQSVAHYYVGNVPVKVKWDGNQIYVDNGKGQLNPVNMDRGVDAIRRLVDDPAYQAWAAGGEAGLRSWLLSSEGHAFMNRSNILADFENNGGSALLEAERGQAVSASETYRYAVDHYVDTQMKLLFEGFEDAAPTISATMKSMAIGEIPGSAKSIRAAVEEANRSGVVENPYVSIPPMLREPLSARMTGRLMTMNKVNRVAVYNRVFNKAFDDIKKEGATPDAAARVAADIADLVTTRIHFDLSNALGVEAQFRWFAWFATKHRLYNTYLTRMAFERPSIAGAVQTFQGWVETRNEDDNIPDYDKGTIGLSLDFLGLPENILPKGTEMRLNLGTLYWIGDMFQESSLGQLVEGGAFKVADWIPGMPDTGPNFSEFGLSTGRWDNTLWSIGAAIPVLDAWASGTLTDEWTEEYLNGEHLGWLGSKARNSIKKAMDVSMATAMHEGVELTPAQALGLAVTRGLAYQTVQMGKIWPGRITFGDANKYDDMMRDLYKMPPEQREQQFRDNPDLRFMIGVYSTNPAEQYDIVAGFKKVQDVYTRRSIALSDAQDNGTIFDKNVAGSIYNTFDDMIDQMVNPDWRDPTTGEESPLYNETFGQFWEGSGMAAMSKEEIFKAAFPLADPRAVTRDGYIPTARQKKSESDRLSVLFVEEAKRRNLPFVSTTEGSYPNTDDAAVFWLKQDMVVDPLHAFMKGQDGDGWTTSFANTVARDLARGPAGPQAGTKFLTQRHHLDVLAEYAKGTDGTAKAGVAGLPMFATMTTLDKEQISWNSNIDTEQLWRTYSTFWSMNNARMAELGISPTSKQGEAMRDKIKAWAEEQGQKNPTFAYELHFGQQPLDKRLTMLGIGTGNSKEDEGWAEFLPLVASYRNTLENTMNPTTKKMGVGPTAQAAYPVFQEYAPYLVTLKQRYPEWWKQLLSSFGGISKFGFVRWKMPTDLDNELWQGQSIEVYDPFAEGGE